MEELVYLLKVGPSSQGEVNDRLLAKKSPTHVRLATIAPLSNFGFPEGSEGSVLKVRADGLIVGVEGSAEAPSLFVPWQNVAYLADGTALAKSTAKR